MPQRLGLNLLRPAGNAAQIQQYYNVASLNTVLNQGQHFRAFQMGGFNSMVNRISNAKPGCGSCGK
jgi:hypothetical protein